MGPALMCPSSCVCAAAVPWLPCLLLVHTRPARECRQHPGHGHSSPRPGSGIEEEGGKEQPSSAGSRRGRRACPSPSPVLLEAPWELKEDPRTRWPQRAQIWRSRSEWPGARPGARRLRDLHAPACSALILTPFPGGPSHLCSSPTQILRSRLEGRLRVPMLRPRRPTLVTVAMLSDQTFQALSLLLCTHRQAGSTYLSSAGGPITLEPLRTQAAPAGI